MTCLKEASALSKSTIDAGPSVEDKNELDSDERLKRGHLSTKLRCEPFRPNISSDSSFVCPVVLQGSFCIHTGLLMRQVDPMGS